MSGCPSGTCWGSCRTTASASVAGCRGSCRPVTVGWGGWARWWCETGRSWGCGWRRQVSTCGRTGDDEAWHCDRGSARVRRTPVVRRARSDASTASSSIPVTHTNRSFTSTPRRRHINATADLHAVVEMLPEMLQPDAFCEHTIQQNATAAAGGACSAPPVSSPDPQLILGGDGKGKGGEG